MDAPATFVVLGGTGQTGRHFVDLALEEGHRVRVLARDPSRLTRRSPRLEVRQGDVTDPPDLDELLHGATYAVAMLGDAALQQTGPVNATFVRRLVPALSRQGVARFLYQAGALSRAPGRPLPPALRAVRRTLARGHEGQHRDNEAVMEHLVESGGDLEWIVHRAGIGSDGPSRGVLERSESRPSIATFRDCASYGYRILSDDAAVHTCDLSRYAKG